MDRRTYLISVFDDTLERINGNFNLHKTQQQSIAAQKLILETETLDIPAALAYNDVLPEFSHHFRTIEFAVYCRPYDDSNYRAFKEIISVSDLI